MSLPHSVKLEAPGIDWRRLVSTALGVLAGAVAAAGTLAVVVAGFALSYDAIGKVGVAAGVRADWAGLLPVSIDGAMAVATVTAVVMSRMGRQVWYPWAVVLAGAAISIVCNALHAQMRDQIKLDDNTAMAVSAIPAVMLALSVHLLVVLIDAAARTLGEPDAPAATAPATPAAPVEADPAVAALCAEVLDQARRARHEIGRSLIWQPRPTPLLAASPPARHAIPATAMEAQAAPVAAANPPAESPATPPRVSAAPAKNPASTAAAKVAEWHAKMPNATHAEIAEKAGVSLRSVERHRPAMTATVNGRPGLHLV